MDTSKPWYQSTTIWGAVIAILVPLLSLIFKVQIDAATTADLSNWLAGVGASVGGLFAIIGRVKASTTVK